MHQLLQRPTEPATVADLLRDLGDIPPGRVLMKPAPGTATEQDYIAAARKGKVLFELVDGTFVEKAMGSFESRIEGVIYAFIDAFVFERKLGITYVASAPLRILPGMIRLPDVGFVSVDRLPNRRIPKTPVADLVPDLAVEVISEGNTEKEMERKLNDYFKAGVRLVWYVYPDTHEFHVYTKPTKPKVFGDGDTVTGGRVLPGFELSIDDVFARADPEL